MHPDLLRYYAHMQKDALLEAAYKFGIKIGSDGFDATENPHDFKTERAQYEAWYKGYQVGTTRRAEP